MSFSAPMIRALQAGRKTQTRRLLTSRSSQFKTGERIWVREEWVKIRSLPLLRGYCVDGARPVRAMGEIRSPAMHMPRWASRLTLHLTDVRRQHLLELSAEDAIAEGLLSTTAGALRRNGYLDEDGGPPCPEAWPDDRVLWAGGGSDIVAFFEEPRVAYFDLWEWLHRDAPIGVGNPEVVALTFTVEPGNIDGKGPACAE